MAAVKIFNKEGAEQGEVTISDELLESSRGGQAVHDAVVAYMNAQRAGTASTKNKSEVAGTGAKPWRQKGTGRARAGYKQSNVWRGGAAAFGPRPRSFDQKINKKVARLAFKRVMSEGIEAGRIRILDELALETPKTSEVAAVFKALGLEGSTLLVIKDPNEQIALSVRNMPQVDVQTADGINTYQVLRFSNIVITREAFDVLEARLKSSTNGEG